MRNIIYFIKLKYRYIHKRYFVMLFLVISITIILFFQKSVIRCFFNKNNSNIPIIIEKYISYQSEDILNKINYNNIMHINILNKYLYFNKPTGEVVTYNYIISQGDTLNRVLMKNSNNGINFSDISHLIRQYPILKNLQTGQILSWLVIANKNLKYLIWDFSSQEIRVYNRVNTNFSEGIIRIVNQLNNQLSNQILFIGVVNGTFIDSARSIGVEENYILDIINALRYQLDFRKLHQGDKFIILISILINDNFDVETKFIGARICVAGKDHYVFRANNGKFYDRKAMRLGSDFIRFPISKPFRVSSNFNLHRLNPITRQISPHAGVDFAVPIGTPILSVGDGEVIISTYSKIAGNYVVIRHNYRCITRYMHLNKLLVRPGQKVRCGDNIALSGNTGRSTGPHLHFEIWIDRHPVNPLTVKLLNVEKLLGNDRIIYLNQINKIVPQLYFD